MAPVSGTVSEDRYKGKITPMLGGKKLIAKTIVRVAEHNKKEIGQMG